MLLELSSDQEFFRETTARFLERAGAPSPSCGASATTPPGSTQRLLAPRRRAGLDLAARRRGARRRLDLGRGARRPHAGRPRVRPPRRARAARADQRRRRRAERRRRRHHDLLAGLLDGTVDRHVVPRRGAAERRPRRRGPRRSRSTATTSCSTASKRPVESAGEAEPPPRHRAHRRRPHPGARAHRRAGRLDRRRCTASTSPGASRVVTLRRRAGAGRRGRRSRSARPTTTSSAQLQHALVLANAESVGAMQAAST